MVFTRAAVANDLVLVAAFTLSRRAPQSGTPPRTKYPKVGSRTSFEDRLACSPRLRRSVRVPCRIPEAGPFDTPRPEDRGFFPASTGDAGCPVLLAVRRRFYVSRCPLATDAVFTANIRPSLV